MNQSELDAICVDSQKRGKTSVLITFGSYFWLVKKMARDFSVRLYQLKTLNMNVTLAETLNLTVFIVHSSLQPMLTYILLSEEVNLFSGSVEQNCCKRKRSK